MLRLFNSLGKKIETFHPVNRKVVNIFTCGPSVYQRAHIGNFRTFLFEDILARYLEYSGYRVKRGMNFTDIEDKAIREAEKRKTTVKYLTENVIKEFIHEMRLLRMKLPDYLPRASDSINETVGIIEILLERGIAYWYKGNVYFDPLKFPDFGKIYGLDISAWPSKKRRFHTGSHFRIIQELKKTFSENMDNDLDVQGTFDGLYKIISSINISDLKPGEASGIIQVLRKIDEILKVIF